MAQENPRQGQACTWYKIGRSAWCLCCHLAGPQQAREMGQQESHKREMQSCTSSHRGSLRLWPLLSFSVICTYLKCNYIFLDQDSLPQYSVLQSTLSWIPGDFPNICALALLTVHVCIHEPETRPISRQPTTGLGNQIQILPLITWMWFVHWQQNAYGSLEKSA